MGCFCWTWAGKSLFQRSIVFTVHHGRRCPCTASQSIPSPAKVKLVLHVLVLRMTGSVWRTLRVSLLLLCDTLTMLIHFLGSYSLFWFWCCMIVCCIHMLLFGLFVSSGDIMKNVIICKSILCSCLVIFPRIQCVGVCCSTSFPILTLLIIFFKKINFGVMCVSVTLTDNYTYSLSLNV